MRYLFIPLTTVVFGCAETADKDKAATQEAQKKIGEVDVKEKEASSALTFKVVTAADKIIKISRLLEVFPVALAANIADVKVKSAPTHGAIDTSKLSEGILSYSPTDGFVGKDTFKLDLGNGKVQEFNIETINKNVQEISGPNCVERTIDGYGNKGLYLTWSSPNSSNQYKIEPLSYHDSNSGTEGCGGATGGTGQNEYFVGQANSASAVSGRKIRVCLIDPATGKTSKGRIFKLLPDSWYVSPAQGTNGFVCKELAPYIDALN